VTAVAAPARAAATNWVTGTPLWPTAADEVAGGDQLAMRRPALIRFASDNFMDELTATLQRDPGTLASLRATPTSYRQTPPGAPAGWQPTATRLKLFQPLHGHFNLVVASLVCRLAGLPDHTVKPADGERAAFVLRRLAPGSAGTALEGELAWAPVAGVTRWVPLATGTEAAQLPGEELFPMFPVGYQDGGMPRRIWAGLIPTSSRDTFAASKADQPVPSLGAAGGRADDDPRWNQFDLRVLGPLTDLQATPPQRVVPQDLRAEASAFVLLDLADLLRAHLPGLWQALQANTAPPAPAEAALYHALHGDPGVDWRGRLLDAAANWAVITGEQSGSVDLHCDLHDSTISPTGMQTLFRAAVPGTAPTGAPPDLDLPKIEPAGDTLYVVRCVYLRPQCPDAEPVSAPSDAFSIAPVFDPDAPSRPIRIPMPIDTGIKDLRKFPKNVGFLLSNQLRGQMNRVTDLKKALDGQIADEEHWDLGVICQFSLPIITIVALLLLIAVVFVLNIVFFWTAFFRICIPVPLRSRSRS
jgi:hypothetical protein